MNEIDDLEAEEELEEGEEEDEDDAEEEVVLQGKSRVAVDLDTASDTLTPEQMSRLGAERKQVNKPDISRLPDALGPDGMPLFKEGDKIVIERYASSLPNKPYLDTKTYKVLTVDMATGYMRLSDEGFLQYARDNWKIGPKHGSVYKLAQGKITVSHKKRGRPRKDPVEDSVKPAVQLGPDGQPIKKKRGRPAGAKNRSREEIVAEKTARREEKLAKKSLIK